VATRKIVNGNAVTLQRRGVVPVPSLPRRAVERPRKPVGPILMAKRPRTPRASARPPGRPSRPGIIHTSIYLPEALYEALREAAFRERCKIHDIVLEGIESALRKRGRKQ
jgi:hypothetical protein